MEAVRTAFKEGRIPKVKIIFGSNCSEDQYGIYGNITEVNASIYFYGGYIRLGCMSVDGMQSEQIVSHTFGFDETGSIISCDSWYLNLNSAI